MDLAEETYRVTGAFPKDEIYGLTAQLRRCAVSVPSNIAEGFGRENRGSFTQFLRIAQGSPKELETQMLLASRIRYLGETDLKSVMDRAEEVGKMIRGLINSLKSGGSEK